MKRLIPTKMIPDSLWNRESSILHLPPQLISSWILLLDKYGLREKAMQCAPEGFVGGMSEEDTNNHLAWRFTGSSARVMLPMLAPFENLSEISNAFARTFSGNKVFLADLPCGSGAASMSILSVLCELRKQGCIPRMPLEIVILGGEISRYAQNYAKEALGSLIKDLEEQAVTIQFEVMDWDVCDSFSNTDLIRQLTLRSQDCASKFLVFANFSGFLQNQKKWEVAQKQFDELFRHSRVENSIAIWIEPNTKAVTTESGGFIIRVIKWFNALFFPFVKAEDDENHLAYATSLAEAKHPLIEGSFRVTLVVRRFDFPLQRRS